MTRYYPYMKKRLKPEFWEYNPDIPTFGDPYKEPLDYKTHQVIRNRQELAFEILCNPAFLSKREGWKQIRDIHTARLGELGSNSSKYVEWARLQIVRLPMQILCKWCESSFRANERQRLMFDDAIIVFWEYPQTIAEIRNLVQEFQDIFQRKVDV